MHRFPIRPASRVLASALTLVASSVFANTFELTYEAPGVQNSTSTFSQSGIETFDARSVASGQTFVSDFGGSGITGTYTGIDIRSADVYGGAGGNTNFASTSNSTGYSLQLSQQVNYFGFWLSALDSGNVVSFYNGATEVGTYNAGNILSHAVTGNSAYFGNPNAAFLGGNGGQAYAFVNVYSTTGTFDRVVFAENPQIGGYESDNHTVGDYTTITGTAAPVPEPASSVLLAIGATGLLAWRRRMSSSR